MGVIPFRPLPAPATPALHGTDWWTGTPAFPGRVTVLEGQRQMDQDALEGLRMEVATQAGIIADQYEALIAANERIFKLQADLEAAQAIIADHGKTITRLRADLARAGAELDRLTTPSPDL